MTILEKIKFEEDWLLEVNLTKENIKIAFAGIRATALEQQPCEDVLEKIKTEISRYELDCRFADYSQTDECTICNKNVFGSIYKIIDKYIEGSDSK